jgi:pSer/pThr/pTyr-binding forkhead associated (FHA) protein
MSALMSEKKTAKTTKSGNADWFVQGALSRIGDIFDKLTGRGWNKSSSLSTSELTERLKMLLDSEVKDLGAQGKFVPHHIKLKMQWNKFSTDSEKGLQALEYELLASAIDHINDNLYHTYKPLRIEVKPDYFTEGVKFIAGFGEFGEEEAEAEVNVSVPQMKVQNLIPQEQPKIEETGESYIAEFTVGGKAKTVELKFDENKKRNAVGRTKENDLVIEDISISKIHAALVLNPEKLLLVADTGSTNGTFINNQRITYGRAFPLNEGDKLKFGTVEVFLRRVPKETDFATKENYEVEPSPTENYQLPAQETEVFELEPKPTEAYQLPEATIASTQIEPLPTKTSIIENEIQKETAAVENKTNEEPVNPTQQHIVKLNFDE